MERFALEYNKRGQWVKLNHYSDLSYHKANFLYHLCEVFAEVNENPHLIRIAYD